MARPPDEQLRKASHGRFVGWVLGGGILAALATTVLLIPGVTRGQVLVPPITHPIEGREACTQCHGALPSSHEGRADETCVMCHSAAPAPTPTPVPGEKTPEPTPTDTPTPPPGPSPTAEATTTPAPTEVTSRSTPPAAPTSTPLSPPSPTGTVTPLPNDLCLACHGIPGSTITFASGDTVPLTVLGDTFRESVHGGLLVCQDCYRDYQEVPHPAVEVSSYRDYAIAQYEVCKRCHFANYTKTLDGAHYQVLSAGNLDAPLCTDCHGAHKASAPSRPRSRMA